MKKFLFLLCWVFSLYTGVECQVQPHIADPIDRLKTVLKINRRVGHVVAEIRPQITVFHYYEFTLSRKKKKLKLLDTKVGNINFQLKNVKRFKKEAVSGVNQFKSVFKLKNEKVSASVVLAEELRNNTNSDELCQGMLDAFSALDYHVKDKKCLRVDANEKMVLMWFQLNGGFQSFGKKSLYPIIHLSSDLAGVAFPITTNTNLTDVDQKQIFKLPIHGIMIYANGNEKMGFDHATTKIFHEENKGVDPAKYQSSCLYPGFKYYAETSKANYTIIGNNEYNATHKIDMRKCLESVHAVVETFKKPPQLPGQKILSASNSYKRIMATQMGEDWRVDMNDIYGKCQSRCSTGDYNKNPKRCMNAIYAYTLLRDYFRFRPQNEILNFSNLDLHEVHWTLTVAFLKVFQRYIRNGPDLDDKRE